MEKFDLTKLPELDGHPELKAHMEAAWGFLQTEQYRAAANELRLALEYIIDCCITEASSEGEDASVPASLYDRIELLKQGDWITSAQADSFHSIRMRCNAGVHRASVRQGKQMNPVDIRYSYELLVQSLSDFLMMFPGKAHEKEEAERTREARPGEAQQHKHSFLEDRAGEASEGVFSEMMEELLKKIK